MENLKWKEPEKSTHVFCFCASNVRTIFWSADEVSHHFFRWDFLGVFPNVFTWDSNICTALRSKIPEFCSILSIILEDLFEKSDMKMETSAQFCEFWIVRIWQISSECSLKPVIFRWDFYRCLSECREMTENCQRSVNSFFFARIKKKSRKTIYLRLI